MLSRLITRKEQLLILGLIGAICIGAGVLYFHDMRKAPEALTTRPVVPVKPMSALPVVARPAATAPPIEAAKTSAPPAPDLMLTPPSLAISVNGAVESPGMYRLKFDARLQDAIDAAGGATDEADLRDLNMAAKVVDGSTLIVPAKGIARTDGKELVVRGGQSAAELNLAEYTISGSISRNKPTVSAEQPSPARQEPAAQRPTAKAHDGPVDLNSAPVELLDTLPGVGPKTAQDIVNFRAHTPFTCVDDLKNVRGIGPKKLEALRPMVTVTPR